MTDAVALEVPCFHLRRACAVVVGGLILAYPAFEQDALAACNTDGPISQAASAAQRGDWEATEAAATQVLRCDPQNVDALILLAERSEYLGDYDALADRTATALGAAHSQRNNSAIRKLEAMAARAAVVRAMEQGRFEEAQQLLVQIQGSRTLDVWSERDFPWISVRTLESTLAQCLATVPVREDCGSHLDAYNRAVDALNEEQRRRSVLSSTTQRQATLNRWFELRASVNEGDWSRIALQRNDFPPIAFYRLPKFLALVDLLLAGNHAVEEAEAGRFDGADQAIAAILAYHDFPETQQWATRFQHRLDVLRAIAGGECHAGERAIQAYRNWKDFESSDAAWVSSHPPPEDPSCGTPNLGWLRPVGHVGVGTGIVLMAGGGVWARVGDCSNTEEGRFCDEVGFRNVQSGNSLFVTGAALTTAGVAAWVIGSLLPGESSLSATVFPQQPYGSLTTVTWTVAFP